MRTAARTCASIGTLPSALTLASNLEEPDTNDDDAETGATTGAVDDGRGTELRPPGKANKLWRLPSSRRLDSSRCWAAKSSKFCQFEPIESRSGQPALHASNVPSFQRRIS